MTTRHAPYLKVAIMFAVLAALYAGFYLLTRKPMSRQHFPPPPPMAMGHTPRGFLCKFRFPQKMLFTVACVPDCRTAPAAPDTSTFFGIITAEQTTRAIWHRACDAKQH
jgi:hypothetical protein